MKFINYDQNQSFLLPPSLAECLPDDHICFVISDTVDRLDLASLEASYTEEGHPAYHPKMMIKTLFYAYSQGVRSSRKIENKTDEDIAFRYLTANTHIDHGTVNLFRKSHLNVLPAIFTQIVLITAQLGLADFSDISLDGTKIKAQAAKSALFNKEEAKKLTERIEKVLAEAEEIDSKEDKQFGDKRGYNQIPKKLADPKTRRKEIEKLKKKIADLEKAGKTIDQKEREAKETDEKNNNTRHGMREQDKTGTHTTNLTDPDSTLMKMKDGSYKMAYNVQITTSKQVVAAYGLANNSSDTKSLPQMIAQTETNTGQKVEKAKADAAYFNKTNIRFLKDNQINAFIPDSLLEDDRRKEREMEKDPAAHKYDRKNFKYDEENDQFICPEGNRTRHGSIKRDKNGKELSREYICTHCQECPAKALCTKGKERTLKVDWELEAMRNEMRTKLSTDEGKEKYQERFYEVEPIMGNLKHNQNFTEFLCRGKAMALVELGLASSAHNLKKIFCALKRKGIKRKEIPWDSLLNTQTA